MSLEPFLGKWKLISERCRYEIGEPPQKGTYEILRDGDRLTFLMDWVDQAGEGKQMSFSEICDGTFHIFEDSPAVDEIKLSLLDAANLQSLAKKDGVIIMTADRELQTNRLLKVTMGGPLPDGTNYSNISFYEK